MSETPLNGQKTINGYMSRTNYTVLWTHFIVEGNLIKWFCHMLGMLTDGDIEIAKPSASLSWVGVEIFVRRFIWATSLGLSTQIRHRSSQCTIVVAKSRPKIASFTHFCEVTGILNLDIRLEVCSVLAEHKVFEPEST